MSNIPKAREILLEAIDDMPMPWRACVEAALELMYREAPAKRRAPVEKQPMDAFLAERIRAYVARHPAEQLQDVAGLFNVNIGRVSEALHWKR